MKINLRVKPNSDKQKIEFKEGVYFISLKSRAENNKANIELLKLLKRNFKKEVRIISGKTSKNKIVEILNN